MGKLYAAVENQIKARRKIGTEQYHLSERRRNASRLAAEAVAARFKNLPRGLQQFSAEWLGHPETTYLRIDLRGPEGHISNHQKLTLTRIGFVERDGERFAVDLDRNVDLGLVNAFSFRRDSLNEPDWMKYNSHPAYRRVWQDLHYHDHTRPGDALLVLTGPMLAHGAIAAMARFAASVCAGGQPETAALNAFDREMAKLHTKSADITAATMKLVDDHTAKNPVGDEVATLVREIASMDWTFNEADRPDHRFYDQQTRIRDGLNALDLDAATALFVTHNRIYFEYVLSYLQRHPSHMAVAA